MREFKTEKREKKIVSVAEKRQRWLKVVVENVHDPHNVSAIFRTCDAVGVPSVSLIYNLESFPKIGKKSSASAFKWVEREKYKTVKECYEDLRTEGYKIYASSIQDGAKNLYDLDLTGKTALVFGNEHRGVSGEAASLADERFLIPMFGMVQSLNVSVAAAVTLYEALRQRLEKSDFTEEELDKLIDKWCRK